MFKVTPRLQTGLINFYKRYYAGESVNKPKLVILGSGWGSFRTLNKLDLSRYQVSVISPRNHFLFTPLLASTTTGTLSFRSIIEPIRKEDLHYYMAKCTDIDINNKIVHCEEQVELGFGKRKFSLEYDKLVLGVGCDVNTFRIPGVKEHAFFLKELVDSRRIRGRIIDLFEKASIPNRPVEEQRKLLHIIIVGAGPTGVEFAGELSDFFWKDLTKYYPDVPIGEVQITILEAAHTILSAFDQNLVKQAIKSIKREGVTIRTDSTVKEVKENSVVLGDGSEMHCGMVVWSTGIGPRKFTLDLPFKKTNKGRILVDDHLRVLGQEDIYALGDCAEIEGMPLAATAQVAQQQGKYLARVLNSTTDIGPFKFRFRGIMLYTGSYKSVFDTVYFKSFGYISWVLWRSVYLTSLGSLRNRLQVPADWLRTLIWGRDTARF